MKNKIILCVDLEEWFHGRWATGSPIAHWKTVQDFLRENYHSSEPIGEIIEPTNKILNILKESKIKATFFILGEIAEWYPNLVKKIAADGHEIASHGQHHRDLSMISKNQFAKELVQSRRLLEKLTGQKVIGFRAPNLVITPWLPGILIREKFRYDSSVCPSRSLQGKFINQTNAPCNPYRTSGKTLLKKGDAPLYEIPIPVFPFLKLPGAVSIATRIFGLRWTKITLNNALKTGSTCYYVHPYEFTSAPKLKNPSLKDRVFLRRTGSYMTWAFKEIIENYRERIVTAREYLNIISK